jgi:pimeloyl-ACP methyl ester carboxylesterase
MPRSQPVDGFRLAYDDTGDDPPVVLLHGWPGDRQDYRAVVPLLRERAGVIVPDLRGFGASDKPADAPAEAFGADAQARSVLGLLDELGVESALFAGYDIGSRIAQTVASAAPARVRALVIAPPVPGAGTRVLEAGAAPEFWYQHFHRLPLAAELVDGDRDAVAAYLRHFWTHWSGPGYEPSPEDIDRLAESYAEPGAFIASINWYRGGSGMIARSLAEEPPEPDDRIAPPTTVLWPEHDPLFPRAWGDRLGGFFADATVREVAGSGHFVPLERPDVFADAIGAALA